MSRAYKPLTLALLNGLLFALLLLGPLSAQAVDHSPKWNPDGKALTYGLVDLDNFHDQFHNDDYGYCQWGNWLDDAFAQIPLVGPFGLTFDWLTLAPFQDDLFLSPSKISLQRMLFPGNSTWQAPNGAGQKGTVTFSALGNSYLILFRYLHFSNQLKDEITDKPLDDTSKKIIVLIHGWNANASADSFSGEFALLRGWLINRLRGTDWNLVLYHWEADADTGPAGLLPPDFHPDSVFNATDAAEIAHQHGQHLGELLDERCPRLENVHFLAHSAGSWTARAATKFLLDSGRSHNNNVRVQVTLLDPFIPGSVLDQGRQTSLKNVEMSKLAQFSGNDRLWLLESYNAHDQETGCEFGGTQDVFIWRTSDINLQIDWDRIGADAMFHDCKLNVIGGQHYSKHAGPIQFYADTAQTTVPGQTVSSDLSGAPYNYRTLGWWRSIFMNEPVIKVKDGPLDQTVEAGQAVTLIAAASTRAVELGASYDAASQLHFQWQHNGQPVGTDAPILRVTSANDSDAGSYLLVAKNAAGTATSRTATVTVKPVNQPVIVVSGDLSFGFVQIGSKATKDLVVSNSGTADLVINSVTFSSSSLQEVFSANFNPGTIPVGGSKEISLTFSPATAASYDGTITFVSNAGNASAPVSGSGVAVAKTPSIQTSVPEVSGTKRDVPRDGESKWIANANLV